MRARDEPTQWKIWMVPIVRPNRFAFAVQELLDTSKERLGNQCLEVAMGRNLPLGNMKPNQSRWDSAAKSRGSGR